MSAGHACLFQYIFLHFAGYEAWTLGQIKMYHSPATSGSMAAGHPEIEYPGEFRKIEIFLLYLTTNETDIYVTWVGAQPGIEVTTGPLGQGIANAVGMAIAAKQLAATYNRDELKVVDNKIWCFTGDGCLQEGVGQECERLDGGGTRMSPDRADSACLYPAAISLAGHLGLDNLILIYDNNRVTVDGSIDNCFTEDTSAKLIAQGWHVIDVHDGSNDVSRIYSRGDLRVPQMLSISAQG